MPCGIQETTGCVNVLATRCANSCSDAVSVEIVAEVLHCLLVATLKVNVRNLVIADEVDAAVKSAQQLQYLFGVSDGVVDTAEHGVLECEAALAGSFLFARSGRFGNGGCLAHVRHGGFVYVGNGGCLVGL